MRKKRVRTGQYYLLRKKRAAEIEARFLDDGNSTDEEMVRPPPPQTMNILFNVTLPSTSSVNVPPTASVNLPSTSSVNVPPTASVNLQSTSNDSQCDRYIFTPILHTLDSKI